MPTVTTIVRGNGREEGDIDSGLSQVRPPPPPVPPPMANKISGILHLTQLGILKPFCLLFRWN